MIKAMPAPPCTRCGRTLPPDVLRELDGGTRCPFCAALLQGPRTDPRPRAATPTGRASVLASTIMTHTGNQASAAPPDAAAGLWLLLSAKAWQTPPAVPAGSAAAAEPTVASAPPAAPVDPAALVVEPAAPSAPPPPPLEALPELPQTAFDNSGPVQAAPAATPPP